MMNLEFPSKKSLGTILQNIKDGQYVIPDFQREFEWKPWDIQDLIKSIFADYYIGTLLLWRATKENVQSLNCESIYGYSGRLDPQHIILDGQQRISALHYAFFAPDATFPNRNTKYYYFAHINKILDEDWDEPIGYYFDLRTKNNPGVNDFFGSLENQYKQGEFPLYLLGRMFDWIDWVRGYGKWLTKNNDPDAEIKEDRLMRFFKSLLESYDVSFIELDKDIEVSKVCDIFTKINSTGIKLTIFDLLNAMLKPKGIGLKEMWRKSKNQYSTEFEKMNIYLLEYMSIVLQDYCSPSYLYYLVPGAERVIKKDGDREKRIIMPDNDNFMKLWEEAKQYCQSAIQKIQNNRDFGAIQTKFISYPSMIPILGVFLKMKEGIDNNLHSSFDDILNKWYWASIFNNNYSSGVESTMTQDYLDFKKWLNGGELPRAIKQLDRIEYSIDLIKEMNQSSAIYNAIFCLLVRKGAKDFYTLNLPEYSILEDHHIVPNSWGRKNGVRNINSILNKSPISDRTNKLIIKDRLPNQYFKEIRTNLKNDDQQFYALMDSHMISRKAVEILMRENFSVKDYDEFIEERNNTVMTEIKSLFGEGYPENILVTPNKPFSNLKLIKDLLSKANDEIMWVDKYFSGVGLNLISEVVSENETLKLNRIRIITSSNKVDRNIRDSFKRLKEELNYRAINIEIRVIIDSELKNSLHDRWLIIDSLTYNIPSTDTLGAGQFSEITKTDSFIPFDDWWSKSLDLITDWNKIEQSIN